MGNRRKLPTGTLNGQCLPVDNRHSGMFKMPP